MFDEERKSGDDAVEPAGAKELGRDWREIDRKMRRVASRRGALDAEEARLLIAAKQAEVHKHLGYGTFDEYLERVLGYAPTTGRDKLRVAETLRTLPAIASALASGALSYSAVREITRVATPDTEEDWVVHVEGMTVREIEQCVRCHEPGDGPDDRPRPDLAPRVVRMELPPQTYALFLEARRRLEREHGHSMTGAPWSHSACARVMQPQPSNARSPTWAATRAVIVRARP